MRAPGVADEIDLALPQVFHRFEQGGATGCSNSLDETVTLSKGRGSSAKRTLTFGLFRRWAVDSVVLLG